MFGTFQQSQLRIEVQASGMVIRDCLLSGALLQQWLFPAQISLTPSEVLQQGLSFTTGLGPIAIHHDVERVDERSLRLILSQAIDGVHEWHWGDGWVQSALTGVSLLPLHLGQTASLLRLRSLAEQQATRSQPSSP